MIAEEVDGRCCEGGGEAGGDRVEKSGARRKCRQVVNVG